MASQDPVISCKSVSFGYERHHRVVEDVNADLLPGKLTVLLGPNAAGKSTLLRLMLGLLRPLSGSVDLAGLPVCDIPPRDRARSLSYVPQRPGVRFAFTVGQIVAMGLHATHAGTQDLIDQTLNEAGLTGLYARVFHELSGGQQQQVLLARAQVQARHAGRAMLLDEPGSHLDLHHRHSTMQRLRDLAHRGLAVLVVLHDLDLACRYADQAWLMDRGRLVASGPWQDVLTPRRLEPVYRLKLQRVQIGADRPMLAVLPEYGDTMSGS